MLGKMTSDLWLWLFYPESISVLSSQICHSPTQGWFSFGKEGGGSTPRHPLLNKTNKLTIKNKLTIYKTIIRPILTYASPVWCNISDTTLTKIQRFQNKCLRLATNSSRYIKIRDLHEKAKVEMIRDHIDKHSARFYKTRLGLNPLTQNITKTHLLINKKIKHKLPYVTLKLNSNWQERNQHYSSTALVADSR
jgi:hypothetical protein